jgi:hypothetical protein
VAGEVAEHELWQHAVLELAIRRLKVGGVSHAFGSSLVWVEGPATAFEDYEDSAEDVAVARRAAAALGTVRD